MGKSKTHITEITKDQAQAARNLGSAAFLEFLDSIKDLTKEETLSMQGTEFTYIFSSWRSIPCFVAKSVLNYGFTCKVLDQYDSGGVKYYRDCEVTYNPKGYDNIICFNRSAVKRTKENRTSRNRMQRTMKIIKLFGEYTAYACDGGDPKKEYASLAVCSF